MDDRELRLECLREANKFLSDSNHGVLERSHLFWAFVQNDKAVPPATKIGKKIPVEKESSSVESDKTSSEEVSYDTVKASILEVAKTLGRNASLDLLAPFDVVKGSGDERKGNMNDLKPEQYQEVVKKAKEMLEASKY